MQSSVSSVWLSNTVFNAFPGLMRCSPLQGVLTVVQYADGELNELSAGWSIHSPYCLRHWMQGHLLTGEKWGIPFFTYGPFH